MSKKVAVASSDGKFINQHFGHASEFLIFSLKEDAFDFLERIRTKPYCNWGEHDDNELEEAVKKLLGCDIVIASQIGPGAREVLIEHGIEPLQQHGFIEDVLSGIL